MKERLQHIVSESGFLGLLRRLLFRAVREVRFLFRWMKDSLAGTYQKNTVYASLIPHLQMDSLDGFRQGKPIPAEVVAHYLNHCFDLLGSGWTSLHYGMSCRGLEQYRYAMGKAIAVDLKGSWLMGRINQSNLRQSQHIWQLVDKDYRPIDWQLDFKSGYRWSAYSWSKKIKFGHAPGVDVKVPWELARMQHLPQLALFYLSDRTNNETALPLSTSGLSAGSGDDARFLDSAIEPRNVGADVEPEQLPSEIEKNRILKEYQNQLLDFIATNPPGFGVNWLCPMDIGIRAANWLLAWDLFRVAGAEVDPQFERLLAGSIYEHGRYIINNLETNPPKANHYLANIVGLVFISAYLPSTHETDRWMAFAIRELIVEVRRQFHNDGANYEGSTAYHRLSAEMVYYATALILGLPEERMHALGLAQDVFPPDYVQRIEKMVEFMIDVMKPDGEIIQIGDHDSGRFFKVAPHYDVMLVKQAKSMYANLDNYTDLPDETKIWVENHLNCSHLVGAGYGLFERTDFSDVLGGIEATRRQMDQTMIRALSQSNRLVSQSHYDSLLPRQVGTPDQLSALVAELQDKTGSNVIKTAFPVSDGDLLDGIVLSIYPEFGLYIYRSSRVYLAVRCWLGGQPEHASHRHQDQLSIELSLDGTTLIRDPGTYLYTPLPSVRYTYRANTVHFSPLSTTDDLDSQPAHVFKNITLEPMQLLYLNKNGLIIESVDKLIKKQLVVLIEKRNIIIYHANYAENPASSQAFCMPKFSPGYGVQLR